MNGHDEALLDLVAVYALGALPERDARSVEAHLATCSVCRRELSELRAAVDAVALSAEATADEIGGQRSERLKARVMSAVRAPQLGANVVSLERARGRAPNRYLPYLAMAAALALLFVGLFDAFGLRAQAGRDRDRIAMLEAKADMQERSSNEARAQLALTESRVADLLAPNAQRFPLSGGLVARANNRIVIAVQHLAQPPKGKVYQAWTLRKGAKNMTPSVTFVPDTSGLALIELPDAAANLVAVAVSIEPEGGSKAPTSKPTFVRSLS
ncbi:MAG: anti-sigma factor [Candidatus Eremiobacteraeota bacterium]|nr:anti-sigma factor [Candidatus Eremiobacteraeota bacterium]